MKFGDNLQNLRKAKKMSQEKLAEKVGVSRQSVSKWECGESYPEMDNILFLCSIFHCKINDLVHEDLSDIDSLGEEVKMNVVKFKKDQQNKMKGLSKALYIIARVGKIAAICGAVCLFVLMLISPVIINNIRIKDNNITAFGKQAEFYNVDNSLVLKYQGEEYTIQTIEEKFIFNKVIEISEEYSNTGLIVYIESMLVFMVATCVLTYYVLGHLDGLFVNIYNGDTPFTMDNVNHIKKIAVLMIITIILPNISSAIAETIFKDSSVIGLQLYDLIYILFLFSMAHIFEYGYQIQLDSQGKMYGEEE